MKLPFSPPLWFALTVLVPGTVIFAVYRVLVAALGFAPPWISMLDGSEVLTASVIVGIGLFVQVFGIIIEDVFFGVKPRNVRGLRLLLKRFVDRIPKVYRHPRGDCDRCKASGKRLDGAFDGYESTFANHPDDAARVEAIVAQFFMSHNIAVGLVFVSIWATYWFTHLPGTTTFAIAAVSIALTISAWYVAYNRYHRSSQALLHFHEHPSRSQGKEEDAPAAAGKPAPRAAAAPLPGERTA